jgi:hypothetical protein
MPSRFRIYNSTQFIEQSDSAWGEGRRSSVALEGGHQRVGDRDSADDGEAGLFGQYWQSSDSRCRYVGAGCGLPADEGEHTKLPLNRSLFEHVGAANIRVSISSGAARLRPVA